MHKWKRVREMFFHEKKEIKKITKELKIARNTVKKYIKSNKEPRYTKTQKRERKVSKYSDVIKECLEDELIGTVIYEKLQKLGYDGSIITLYRYLKDLGCREKNETTTRFETDPGEQMQYDWKEWKINIGGKEILIYIHCLILGFSRMKYYSISLDKTSDSVIRAILGGMEFFNGYCSRLLIDNGKSMVNRHNTKRRAVEFNDDFLIFTGRYNIKATACFPYRAQTKGKVERPFYYIQEHLLRGLKVETLESLSSMIKEFNDKVNSNFHRGINKTPLEAFEEEKLFLKPYEKMDLSRIFLKEYRKVSNDGYVSFKSNYYPAPMDYCNKTVLIENVMGVTLNIYGEHLQRLKSYPIIHNRKNYRPEHPEHILIKDQMKNKVRRVKSATLKEIVELFGDDGKEFIEGVEARKGLNSYAHLATLLDYVEIYGPKIVKEALRSCLEVKAYDQKAVKLLLGNKLPKVKHKEIRLITPPTKKIIYDLAQYDQIRRCN